MPAPINTLKARLAAGETLHGCWLGMADPYAAEIAATTGFDWLLLDGEHAPNDVRSLSGQLAVIAPSASHAIIRPVDDSTARIKQMLDIGVQTLLIPMVESAAQAERIYRATRYPPEGTRGVGAVLARASGYAAITDYVTTANDQICLLVQVESRAGLAALPEIAATKGIDGIFIGPADLSADMGYPGRPDEPEVRQAILAGLRAIRDAGLTAGIIATDPETIDIYKDAGANFVGVGLDVTLLAAAMRDLAARYGGAS